MPKQKRRDSLPKLRRKEAYNRFRITLLEGALTAQVQKKGRDKMIKAKTLCRGMIKYRAMINRYANTPHLFSLFKFNLPIAALAFVPFRRFNHRLGERQIHFCTVKYLLYCNNLQL